MEYKLPKVEHGTGLLIKVDGTEQVIRPLPRGREVEVLINATCLDCVMVGRAARNDLVMMVDDNGYEVEYIDKNTGETVPYEQVLATRGHFEARPVKALKPVNPKATALYHAICKPGTTHQILGDVVLIHDNDV